MTSSSDIQFNDGAAYEQLMGRWSRKVGSQFLQWCGVPEGLDWLDVGCGNGAFTEEIFAQARPKSIAGIDPSPGQIAYARQRQGCAEAHFQVGDAQSLPFADASFDVASMALVIAFVPKPLKAMLDIKRVVRPQGYVAAYMWDLPGGGVPLAPFYRVLKSLGEPAPMPVQAEISRLEALQELWCNAGLRDVETTTLRIAVRFESFDAFWASNTLPVGPQAERLRSLSDDMRNRLKEALRSTLPTAQDGSITYEAFANAVKGRV